MICASTILFVALCALVQAQQCPLTLNQPTERQALIDFYASTEGFTWLVNVQWPAAGQPDPTDPCCWIGITCKLILGQGVHVTEINLAFNNLKGTLPASIGNLPYLTKLLLHQNRITGALPPALSNLANLELLFLQNNRFTGALPSLTNMRKLQAVYFETNQFTGGFPNLNGLTFLETIDVSDNLLTGPLPTQISNGKLADIRANKNKFTGPVPASWLRLTTLQSIQLSENELTGAVPLVSSVVKVLYLEKNKLGCYAPEVSGTDLKIDGNKFLCQPGVARVPGCVNPAIGALLQPPQGVVQLSAGSTNVAATLTLSDIDPVRGCPDMYCYLGTQRHGQAMLNEGTGQITCSLNPTSVGSYSLSLRKEDGTVITQQNDGAAIIVRVKAGCGGPGGMCNTPQGVCTPDGCICNQAQGWAGAACDEKICPRNCFETTETGQPCPPNMPNPCIGGGLCDASGKCLDQGKCNKATGTCQCNFGFGAADCSQKEVPCFMDCSGRGTCQKQTGICNCYPQIVTIAGRNYTERYTGAGCEQVVCPVFDNKECAGHGTCRQTGGCDCAQYFTGLSYDCSIGQTPCPGCTGDNARCDGFEGKCECARGFTGPGCTLRTCPATDNVECSGHGVCDSSTGKCACNDGWDLVGSCAAQRIPCPMHSNGKPCGGPQYGNCRQQTGVCKCVDNEDRAYTGPACETPICPTIWENCNIGQLNPPRGQCVDAKCQCNAGYAGAQCIDKECIVGSDGSQCNEQSGQGECDVGSGICICLKDPGSGVDGDPKVGCGSALCPNSNNALDCGGNGECVDGQCQCNDGFDGEGCGNAVTDPGPIIGAVIGSICFILSCGVCVFFVLRQRAIAQLTNA